MQECIIRRHIHCINIICNTVLREVACKEISIRDVTKNNFFGFTLLFCFRKIYTRSIIANCLIYLCIKIYVVRNLIVFCFIVNTVALKAPPRNCRKGIRRNGTMTKRTESPRFCSRKAHGFRLAGNACQPEPSSPARIAYSVWRSASAVLGIAFFGIGTAL